MPLLIVVLGIVLLLVLILVFKLHSFLAFVIVSLGVALAEGMGLNGAVASIEKGIGDTLGILVLILGLGAMLGKLVADSGAAQRITSSLVQAFGIGRVQWALMLTAFIVGIPLFYDVGFVIMMPIVFAVVASTGVPLLYVGLPTLAACRSRTDTCPLTPRRRPLPRCSTPTSGRRWFTGSSSRSPRSSWPVPSCRAG